MVQLFRKNWFVFTLLLFPYTLLTRIWVFFDTPDWPVVIENQTNAYKYLEQFFPGNYIANVIIASFLIFINAVIINHIVIKNRIAREINLFPGMLFILLTSLHKDLFWLSPQLISITFMLIAVSNVFRIYQKPNASRYIFNTGLLIGLSALFYAPYIIFLFFTFLSIVTLRKINIRDFVQLLVGFILVFLFIMFLRFWNYGDVNTSIDFSSFFRWNLQWKTFMLNEWLVLLFVFVLTVFTISYYRQFTIKKSIQSQKKVNLIYWFLFIGFVSTLLVLDHLFFTGLMIIFIPLSINGSMLMNRFKNDLGLELLHLFILFFIIFSHFLY